MDEVEVPKMPVVAICETDGCANQGIPNEEELWVNADDSIHIWCGNCQQPIYNLTLQKI